METECDKLLDFQNKRIIQGSESISNSEMEFFTEKVYDEINIKRKHYDAQLADKMDLEEIKRIEVQRRKRKKE